MLSYLDKDLPEPIRAALASLQDVTPPLHGAIIRRLVELNWGRRSSNSLLIGPTPRSLRQLSASFISARLKNGRQVVVKVKYPALNECAGGFAGAADSAPRHRTAGACQQFEKACTRN